MTFYESFKAFSIFAKCKTVATSVSKVQLFQPKISVMSFIADLAELEIESCLFPCVKMLRPDLKNELVELEGEIRANGCKTKIMVDDQSSAGHIVELDLIDPNYMAVHVEEENGEIVEN